MNFAAKINNDLKRLLFIIALVVGLSTTGLQAQKGWEAGLWAGAANYFGDLNTNFSFALPGPAGGVIIRHNFGERTCLRFGINGAYLRASDHLSENIYERTRNLSFESSVIEGAIQYEFNFLPYRHGSRDNYFTPYVLAGINATRFNPKARLDGDLHELRPLGTEGQLTGEEYSLFALGLNYGLGLKFDLNIDWSINIELNARHLYTDYLDDVSTVYPDKDDLEALHGPTAVLLSDRSGDVLPTPGIDLNEIGREGRQRGDESIKDSYVTLGIGIVYYFGDVRCPPTSPLF